MYNSGARWYYATTMRTTSPDPLAEKYYDTSPYAWCGNNPMRNIDPTGMDYWSTNDQDEINRFSRHCKVEGLGVVGNLLKISNTAVGVMPRMPNS